MQDRIWIAVANGIVWVGLFIGLLLVLMRGSRKVDEQISQLEEAISKDEQASGHQ